ncbi:MAG: hypothetical protein U0807_12050 [Candidatus Binatia bacterium]
MEASVGMSTAAPPAIGYFVPDDPALSSSSTTEAELGPHDDHSDSFFTRRNVYRAEDRVNSARLFGIHAAPVRGNVAAGHSFAVASGFADAGSDDLGGGDLGAYAEAGAGLGGRSKASAESDTEVRYHVTIAPGTTGLAPGSPIEGLRWEFGAHGALDLYGHTFPSATAASGGASFTATLYRQHGAICGPGAIVCPHGAVAARASLGLGASIVDLTPADPGDPTGQVTSQFDWSAMRNTGALRAGEVFHSGNSANPNVGGAEVAQDQDFSRSIAFDTGSPPFALDGIDFNATVGETLALEVNLTVTAAVGGGGGNAEGLARLDFFHTVRNRVFDPQQRGVEITFDIDPLPATSSTTTTTSVTTTTLLPCGPSSTCDDGDPCTVDACDATAGCESRPVTANDLGSQVPACSAQPVPTVVGRKLAQGCTRTSKGLAAGTTKPAKRQFAKALRVFAQAAQAAGRAKRRVSPDCRHALRSFFAETRAYVGRLERNVRAPSAEPAPPRYSAGARD